MKNLQPGDQGKLTFTYYIPEYDFNKLKNKSKFEYYISKELYKEQIIERGNKLERYGKAVELSY